jgi:RimJ/RimL family protein N-acetyltransferase
VKNIALTPFAIGDISNKYLDWLKDPEVNRYLESRHQEQNLQTIDNYVHFMIESSDNYLMKITFVETGEHIGNLRIGPINSLYRVSPIGIIIGEKKYWGKGLAAETISEATDFAFNDLRLEKVTAGCYASNVGSQKSFEKAGFEIEGVLKSHVRLGVNREDLLLMAKFNLSN